MPSLTVSIVTFSPDLLELRRTVDSLIVSLEYAMKQKTLGAARLVFVDNGPGSHWFSSLEEILTEVKARLSHLETKIYSEHGNIGYGAGHNLAISNQRSDFHLVLNPDVTLANNSINEALIIMRDHADVGLLSPSAVNEKGANLYLCKRYPSILDLALRGFAPAFIQKAFRKRLGRYEMREIYADKSDIRDVPIVSGCFMLMRRSILDRLKGFSPSYFMYFEDFDLSLRAHELTRVVFAPAVKISHFGGHAARKGWGHIFMFVRSGFRFFQTQGWHLW